VSPDARDALPFDLLIDPDFFLSAELPGIDVSEVNLVRALPSNPVIASIALNLIGYERQFIEDIRSLASILDSVCDSQPVLASSLILYLHDVEATHRRFLGSIEETVREHREAWVPEFIYKLTHVNDILEAHCAYATQVLLVDNFITGFSVDCPREVAARLNGRLLVHLFKSPFQWQAYISSMSTDLLLSLDRGADPALGSSLVELRRANEHLTASIDSIPILEQISKLFLIEPFPIVAGGRRFIKQGRAMKQCRKAITERVLLLFSDFFMYVQPKGGKYMVPAYYKLPFLRVVPSSYDGKFCLDVYAPVKSFILQFGDWRERDSWNLAFQDAIVNARAQNHFLRYKEAPIWIPDIVSDRCMACGITFTLFRRKHHCRNCGMILCSACLPHRIILMHISEKSPSKVCVKCEARLRAESQSERLPDDDEDEERRLMMQRDKSSGPFSTSDDPAMTGESP
jgi:hypothetical protein